MSTVINEAVVEEKLDRIIRTRRQEIDHYVHTYSVYTDYIVYLGTYDDVINTNFVNIHQL